MSIELDVGPKRSQIDQLLQMTVAGVEPGTTVRLTADTTDGAMLSWRSEASFVADEHGTVDLARDAPVAGTYSGVQVDGLLWSMRPLGTKRHVFFTRRRPTPLEVTVTARAEDAVVSTNIQRRFAGPDVEERTSDVPGLIGSLFLRGGGGPRPGVLILGGSDAGKLDHSAALLASHGYAALSLAYFGVEDRPSQLLRIELEYFERALGWLANQPEVDGNALAVVGLSRGGELALLLASILSTLKAVVAASPSSVVQAGISGYTDFTQPAWTLRGEPVAYLRGGKVGPLTFARSMPSFLLRRPMRQRPVFERLSRNVEGSQRAAIAVERIGGPILLVTGGDDRLWPSDHYATEVQQRLRSAGRSNDVHHLQYPGAGHFLSFPYALPSLPPMTMLTPPGAPITIDFGGTPEANAAAARESWPEVLKFLASALDPTTCGGTATRTGRE